MPAVTCLGDKSTGHDNCTPVSAVEGAGNFTVNGKPIVLVGDKYAPHGCQIHAAHQGYLAGGSPSFFVNGRAVGRVGDPVSCGGTAAEGDSFFIIGNGNEQALNKAGCELKETVTKYTRRREDDIFFCLPLIAEEMGNKANEKDRIGWHYLRDMFYKWLAGEANTDAKSNPSPFWVDIDWVLSYEKAKEQWEYAIQNRILNENAYTGLKAKLERMGYIAEKRTEFDFINIPYSEWDKHHYQHITVEFSESDIILDGLSGLYVSLGNFTFKFLAKGKILYTKNDFDIQIEQVAGFVYDLFNFHGDQRYGYWSCKDKDVSIFSHNSYIEMNNAKFNSFREYNKIGNDFLVLSKHKIIDDLNKF